MNVKTHLYTGSTNLRLSIKSHKTLSTVDLRIIFHAGLCRRSFGHAWQHPSYLVVTLSIHQLNVHSLLTHMSLLWIWRHC